MRYAWYSEIGLSSHEKRGQVINWVLTEEGKLRPIALLAERPNTRIYWTDAEELGPVVASCGQWQYGMAPTIDDNTRAVILYLWENTKDEYPDQHNSLNRNINGPLNLVTMDGLNIYVKGAEVTITKEGKSKYFELANPKSLDKILATYKRWLVHKKKLAEQAEKDERLTTNQKRRRDIRQMLTRWAIAVTIVVVVSAVSYWLLPPWLAFAIYAATSYTVGLLTKAITKGRS
jgi:hypothetical protein